MRTTDKEARSSPRAAMAPPHLECDLARGGWTGAAPWTRSPGVALSSVFQASRPRPRGGPRGSRGPLPGRPSAAPPGSTSPPPPPVPGYISRHGNHKDVIYPGGARTQGLGPGPRGEWPGRDHVPAQSPCLQPFQPSESGHLLTLFFKNHF